MNENPVFNDGQPFMNIERHRAVGRNWGWFVALGVLMVLLGIFSIALPIVATFAVTLLVGWVLIGSGVLHFVHAFRSKGWGDTALEILGGVLYILAGLVVLALPLTGAFALTLAVSALFIVQGILRIMRANRLRPFANWGWMLFSGIVSILLGIVIWAFMPGAALWTLGIIVGIELLFSGWATIAMGLAGRKFLHGETLHCVGGQCYSQ